MDHQVIDYVHIQAAGRENTQSVNFEKQRTVHNGFHGTHRGIETLDMPHL